MVIHQHSTPEIVVTDQGRQFTSGIFNDLAKIYGFEHVTTTPYHQQANGMAEGTMQRQTLAQEQPEECHVKAREEKCIEQLKQQTVKDTKNGEREKYGGRFLLVNAVMLETETVDAEFGAIGATLEVELDVERGETATRTKSVSGRGTWRNSDQNEVGEGPSTSTSSAHLTDFGTFFNYIGGNQ
ncbi:hypothetical protein niasHT_033966 [Heterodera trifolii]|uniref:Integrase catalytic domain-containing protein n=1 Tax=Heterodera trifolii TaxID=157864 RepID=A0ABD2IDP9_9BILA